MKANKLKKYERKIEPEITPEQHRQNVDAMFEMIMQVADKLPPNQLPVTESLDELMSQLKHGVKRAPVIVQTDVPRLTKTGAPDVTKI